ncbi:MAG: hypothetical protein NVS9B1_05000 [Candidatus Dormibacteraceae bacterium]
MASPAIRRGLVAGAVAGLVMVALMYALELIAGLRPLTQLLQQPILNVMPGAVFGFLIDTLQHAGKVVEEVGLIVAMVAALAVLGAAYAAVRARRQVPYLGLLFAGVGWVVVCLVLLPLSGDGFLGLEEGLSAPLLWAVLFAVYSVVLEAAEGRWLLPSSDVVDTGRRRLLAATPGLLAAGSIFFLGLRLGPGWLQAIFSPPESGMTGPAPEITPVANFYVVSKNFSDPVVAADGWSLAVTGLVERPQKLNLQQFRDLPSTTEDATMLCVSNNVGGELISTGTFTGPSLASILDLAGAMPGGKYVLFRARDGFTESLPVATVRNSPEILVAHTLDGSPLPNRHGFPARILYPGHYGMKAPKWLDEIHVSANDQNGYWENQGWSKQAVVKTTARFDVPREGTIVRLPGITLAGIAFGGLRGISAVEFSPDGGQHWQPALLKPPRSPLTWSLWTLEWRPEHEGAYTLLVRARDGQGNLQTATVAPSFPDGSSGYHTVRVNVAR